MVVAIGPRFTKERTVRRRSAIVRNVVGHTAHPDVSEKEGTEPTSGFEPETHALRKHCSTELSYVGEITDGARYSDPGSPLSSGAEDDEEVTREMPALSMEELLDEGSAA